jgi:hypothetical protein
MVGLRFSYDRALVDAAINNRQIFACRELYQGVLNATYHLAHLALGVIAFVFRKDSLHLYINAYRLVRDLQQVTGALIILFFKILGLNKGFGLIESSYSHQLLYSCYEEQVSAAPQKARRTHGTVTRQMEATLSRLLVSGKFKASLLEHERVSLYVDPPSLIDPFYSLLCRLNINAAVHCNNSPILTFDTSGLSKLNTFLEEREEIVDALNELLSPLNKQLPAERQILITLGDALRDLTNLTLRNHPMRDFLKNEIIQSLAGQGIPDQGFNESQPYQMTVPRNHLDALRSCMIELVSFDRLVRKSTGAASLQEAITSLSCTSRIDFLRNYYSQQILELHRSLEKKREPKKTTTLPSNIPSLEECQTLSTLEEAYRRALGAILNFHLGVYVPLSGQELYTPSQRDIEILYAGAAPTVTYQRGYRAPNIQKLFETLIATPSFQDVGTRYPALQDTVSVLKADFLHRLNELEVTESVLMQQSIGFFEQYVARIYYLAQSRTSLSSIEHSLRTISATTGSDLSRGCLMGFAGRMQVILLALTEDLGDDLSNMLREMLKGAIDQSFEKMERGDLAGGESSMHTGSKSTVSRFLRLSPGELSEASLDYKARALLTDLKHNAYTPATILERVKVFIEEQFGSFHTMTVGDRERLYTLFSQLGFGDDREHLDREYHTSGDPQHRWLLIQQDLSFLRLVCLLIERKILFLKTTPSSTPELARESTKEKEAAVRPVYEPEFAQLPPNLLRQMGLALLGMPLRRASAATAPAPTPPPGRVLTEAQQKEDFRARWRPFFMMVGEESVRTVRASLWGLPPPQRDTLLQDLPFNSIFSTSRDFFIQTGFLHINWTPMINYLRTISTRSGSEWESNEIGRMLREMTSLAHSQIRSIADEVRIRALTALAARGSLSS